MAEVCLVEVSQQNKKGSWIFKEMVVGTGVWKDNQGERQETCSPEDKGTEGARGKIECCSRPAG